MNTQDSTKKEIPEEALRLLPWYATGWLSPKERSYIKETLTKFPELQELLDIENEIIHSIKENRSILDESSLEPAEARLAKVLRTLEEQPNTRETRFDLSASLKHFFESLFLINSNKTQFAAIAVISTLSIALLYAFISPLMQQNNAFHPAALEQPVNKHRDSATVLLVGLTTKPNDPTLLKILQESHATISVVSGKDGMYRIHLSKKLNSTETESLIKELSTHKELFWFAGEAY